MSGEGSERRVRLILPEDIGPQYMTSQEAADECGVMPQTIRAWVHRGYLQPCAVIAGRRWGHLYLRSDVIECNRERLGRARSGRTDRPL